MPQPRFQFRLRTLFLLTTVAAVCSAIAWQIAQWPIYCTFVVSENRKIMISRDTYSVKISCYYYTVIDNGKETVPRAWCTEAPISEERVHPPSFRLVTKSADVVSVEQQSRDGAWETVIVHNFATGKSFPFNTEDENVAAGK